MYMRMYATVHGMAYLLIIFTVVQDLNFSKYFCSNVVRGFGNNFDGKLLTSVSVATGGHVRVCTSPKEFPGNGVHI